MYSSMNVYLMTVTTEEEKAMMEEALSLRRIFETPLSHGMGIFVEACDRKVLEMIACNLDRSGEDIFQECLDRRLNIAFTF